MYETEKKLIDEVRDFMDRWIAENPEWEIAKSLGTYGDGSFSVKFSFEKASETGYGTQKMRDQWNNFAEQFGLNPDWLDEEITEGKHTLKVIGLDINRPKNCIMLARLSDGDIRIAPKRWLTSRMEHREQAGSMFDGQ